MFSFHWPLIALLLPLPLLIWYFWSAHHINDHTNNITQIKFPVLDRLKLAFSMHQVKASSQLLSLSCLTMFWCGLIFSLMRPEIVNEYSYVDNQGYDLMLAVDISPSMQVLDFSTQNKYISRMDATKEVVGNFINNRKGDRVGLVVFGEAAYLYVPMTLDVTSVSRMLQNVVPGMAGNSTAIGDAIGIAIKNLRERPEGSRVLVLLTDGEDNASSVPPLEAARIAKEYGIRIYTISVGQTAAATYSGALSSVSMGAPSIDEDLLRNIADSTDGKYFHASDPNSLKDVYANIDHLEKTKSDSREYKIRKSLYRYPLSFAAIVFLIMCLMPIIRNIKYII